MNRGRLVAGTAAVLLVAGVVLLVVRAGGVPDVRAAVAAAGIWAPMLFVLLQGAVTITPLPRTVFTVAAGVLFGSVAGVLLAVAGTTLAAVAAFWLVRRLGAGFVQRHSHRAGIGWVRARLDQRGLLAVMSLRMIPMVPFAILNYASGLSGVKFVPYMIGTVLGVLPGTVAIVVLGDVAVGGQPHPALFAVSVLSGLIGVGGALLAARRPALVGEPDPPTTQQHIRPDQAA
ncbi:MAG: TVP38/TMEM64 family protein [Pseudonocardia sp.]|nr:TVP38/TMEM64 family protein [Pseudonocardia sp.]